MMIPDHVVLLLSLLLSGCMPGYVAFKPPPPPMTEPESSPPLDRPSEAAWGGVVMVTVDVLPAQAFIAVRDYPPADVRLRFGFLHYDPIVRGSEWKIIGVLASGDYLCINDSYREPDYNGTRMKGNTALVVDAKGHAYGYASYSGNRASVTEWLSKPGYPILKRSDPRYVNGSYRQELIYDGGSASMIKMTYREFRGDFERPARTQELSYDLGGSRTIEFRGMNIEILRADNSSIQYIIRSPMR